MNRSGAPGIRAKDVFPQFKQTSFSRADPVVHTFYEALSVVGSGILYRISMKTDDAVTSFMRYIQVTIDGVVLTAIGPDEVKTAWVHMVNDSDGADGVSDTLQPPFNIPFKGSLIVEIKTTLALAGGKKIEALIHHGEI